MNPPPPIPDESGSVTPSTPAAPTAASTALPPRRRIRIAALVAEGAAIPAPAYVLARRHQARLCREILASFEGIDALIAPATPGVAPDPSTTGPPTFNSPWSYTGLPSLSFPMALATEGLPLAVQLIGRPDSESSLLGIGLWCESSFRRGDAQGLSAS